MTTERVNGYHVENAPRTITRNDGPDQWTIRVPADVPAGAHVFDAPGGSYGAGWAHAIRGENIALQEFGGVVAVWPLDYDQPAWAYQRAGHARTGASENEMAWCPEHATFAVWHQPRCPLCNSVGAKLIAAAKKPARTVTVDARPRDRRTTMATTTDTTVERITTGFLTGNLCSDETGIDMDLSVIAYQAALTVAIQSAYPNASIDVGYENSQGVKPYPLRTHVYYANGDDAVDDGGLSPDNADVMAIESIADAIWERGDWLVCGD